MQRAGDLRDEQLLIFNMLNNIERDYCASRLGCERQNFRESRSKARLAAMNANKMFCDNQPFERCVDSREILSPAGASGKQLTGTATDFDHWRFIESRVQPAIQLAAAFVDTGENLADPKYRSFVVALLRNPEYVVQGGLQTARRDCFLHGQGAGVIVFDA